MKNVTAVLNHMLHNWIVNGYIGFTPNQLQPYRVG